MSALVWDKSGERLYEMGTKKGVLFLQNTDGTYDTGVAWNGLTGVSENPDGAENNKLYADDMEYASFRSTETFGGTISAYTYPPEFAECDGSAAVTDGVYLGQQKRRAFGFSYVSQIGSDIVAAGDGGYKLHLVYNATVSPSEKSYETINDNPDAIEFSWDFETSPVAVTAVAGLKATSHIVINSLHVDAAKLTSLETMLYGSTDSEPTLPDVNEVITMFK